MDLAVCTLPCMVLLEGENTEEEEKAKYKSQYRLQLALMLHFFLIQE